MSKRKRGTYSITCPKCGAAPWRSCEGQTHDRPHPERTARARGLAQLNKPQRKGTDALDHRLPGSFEGGKR